MGIDENTISDISYIESIRGNVSFRDMWEFWAKSHKTKRVLTLWDACDEYLRDMHKTEKAKPEHIRHVRRVLEVLIESFGKASFKIYNHSLSVPNSANSTQIASYFERK